MKKLLRSATTIPELRRAWHSVRSNGLQSVVLETRQAAAEFDKGVDLSLFRIQQDLRKGRFEFDPQKAIKKKKKSGSYRGIVMASIRNRIVERAILNCLQEKVPYVGKVIEMPTCIGGVPDRSVPHGLAYINSAFKDGNKYFIRSDITSFFDCVPRDRVLKKLAGHIEDKDFLALLDQATTFSAYNEEALGEDRKLFPMNYDGVAQGSPLSPLFGNILLHEFDKKFNQKGIICIRFIDDFILLGKEEGRTVKAFKSAQNYLQSFGLSCHDPYERGTSKEKAQYGAVEDGFVFLGYDIMPGLLQPSRTSRSKIYKKVKDQIYYGQKSIRQAFSQGENNRIYGYAQVLGAIDNIIRGWGNSFSYCNRLSTMTDLDEKIDVELRKFKKWYEDKTNSASVQKRRRADGVCLLVDIKKKSLDELPFRLGATPYQYRKTKNGLIFSTDGSFQSKNKRKEDVPKEVGGWAIVSHKGKTENYGREENTTINRMELRAVIEALRITPVGVYVLIRTDSQYVVNIAEADGLIKENHDLWKQYEHLRDQRKVKIEKVRAHAGDPYNERADKLAKKAVQEVLA